MKAMTLNTLDNPLHLELSRAVGIQYRDKIHSVKWLDNPRFYQSLYEVTFIDGTKSKVKVKNSY